MAPWKRLSSSKKTPFTKININDISALPLEKHTMLMAKTSYGIVGVTTIYCPNNTDNKGKNLFHIKPEQFSNSPYFYYAKVIN